jgi:putative DNA primase/helicase
LWAIAGWQHLRARGRFIQPEAGRELLSELEDLSSPISAFIRECCQVGPNRQEVIKELYGGWKRWCMDKGDVNPGSEQVFCRNLRAALPDLRVAQPRRNGKQVRVYEGIALRTEQRDPVGPC